MNRSHTNRNWAVALGLVGLAALWLFFTADSERTIRQLFGLWRTRHLLVAAALVWLAGAFASAAYGRNSIFRWGFASVLGVATWALLESFGLLGLVDYPKIFGATSDQHYGFKRIPHLHVSGETVEDTATGWGLPSPKHAFSFRTDRYGLRNEPDRAKADVYLLGDSFLVAGLVSFSDTLAPRLEAGLRRPVMNIALLGLGLQEERDLLEDLHLDLKNRLVLQFVFEGNDLIDSKAYRDKASKAGEGPTLSQLAERTLFQQGSLALQRFTDPVDPEGLRRSCNINKERVTFGWTRWAFQPYLDQIPHALEALLDVKKRVQSRGGTYAVVMIPAKIRVLGPLCQWPEDSMLKDLDEHLNPFREHVLAWATEQHVPYLDLTEPLVSAARSGRIPWFAGDTHWNSAGHATAAKAILGWEPVRTWAGRQAVAVD